MATNTHKELPFSHPKTIKLTLILLMGKTNLRKACYKFYRNLILSHSPPWFKWLSSCHWNSLVKPKELCNTWGIWGWCQRQRRHILNLGRMFTNSLQTITSFRPPPTVSGSLNRAWLTQPKLLFLSAQRHRVSVFTTMSYLPGLHYLPWYTTASPNYSWE